MASLASIRSWDSLLRKRLTWCCLGAIAATSGLSLAEASSGVCEGAGITLWSLDGAIGMYIAKNGQAPPAVGWFQALHKSGLWDDPHKESAAPRDPWDRPYVYTRRSDEEFDVRSLGYDGRFGTADDIAKSNGFHPPVCPDPRVHFFGCSWRKR